MLVKSLEGLVLGGLVTLFTVKSIVAPLATAPPLKDVKVASKVFEPVFVQVTVMTRVPAVHETVDGRVTSAGKVTLTTSLFERGELAVTEIL